MARPMYTEAPDIVRRNAQAMFDRGDVIGALVYCCGLGFDVPRPSTAVSDRVAALRAADEHVEASRLAADRADVIDVERRALAMWEGRRNWAAQGKTDEKPVFRAKRKAT